jgi:hypothetical protein
MSGIPNVVVSSLIELGGLSEDGPAQKDQLLRQLAPFAQFRCAHWDEWDFSTREISIEQLAALIRGLVLTEQSLPEWNGGSVSSIIWTFRIYQRRAPDSADELANWIFLYSTNDFAPYGSYRSGANSIADYKAYRQLKQIRRGQSEVHAEEERHCKAIRELVKQRQHRESLTIQKARLEARQELIMELDKLTAKERLEHIAWDEEHDLTFYPEHYAEITSGEINSLDAISRDKFISKIQQRHKGCWAKLNARISTEKPRK